MASHSTVPAQYGAATAVLNTAELCEMIFENLQFQDLLRARRINHFSRDVIQGSKSLQQSLFLLNDTCKVDQDYLLNPLLDGPPNSYGCVSWNDRYWSCSGHPDRRAFLFVVVTSDKLPPQYTAQVPEHFAKMLALQGRHRRIVLEAEDGYTGMKTVLDIDNTLSAVVEGIASARKQLDWRMKSRLAWL